MGRGKFNLVTFGVSSSREDFTKKMADFFDGTYHGTLTADELVLRPREALWFCDEARRRHGYYDVPDDIILRVLLNRRKNSNG